MNSTSNWRRLGEEEEKPKVLAFFKNATTMSEGLITLAVMQKRLNSEGVM